MIIWFLIGTYTTEIAIRYSDYTEIIIPGILSMLKAWASECELIKSSIFLKLN
ncbi:hypothetical protein [Methanobrevibacter sp.]